MIRLLKLSEEHDERLGSEEILSIHLGYFFTHDKVAYSTYLPVADRPKYVLLVLGNVSKYCYLCEVEDYAYKEDENTIKEKFSAYAPDIYKDEKRTTWFLFKSMQKIPVDFLDMLLSDTKIQNFITGRANNKML
ncbi:hypothetical protein [uncultured Clostridium sp.]|uniref:hypothetical protein n=1 Tax=uncultured Clostridium sp. TaxID=59620 RepID=UPI0025FEFB76|nr:hypothetical protein [uncultured Clostridium sp.]